MCGGGHRWKRVRVRVKVEEGGWSGGTTAAVATLCVVAPRATDLSFLT